MTSTPHVVIIGAGFAGLEVAKSLKSADVSVMIIDRLNHHLFQPLLYQVATAALSPADIAVPVRKILQKQKNARFIMATVTAIDTSQKNIVLADGTSISYDWLVVSPGARHSYFGNESWEQYAPGLKTIRDALQIRENILISFEKAEKEDDPKKIEELLTFVIVGGGPTGVEMAGSIAEVAMKSIASSYKEIDTRKARIILVEAAPQILPMYPEKLAKKGEKELTSLGVEVFTSVKVINIKSDGVQTDHHGWIPTKCVIWAAGNQASPLLKTIGCPLDRQGRVLVEKDLSIPDHPEVFVIGDAACAFDKFGKPYPALAPAAKQEGAHVGSIIKKNIPKEKRRPFSYFDKGSMATIGRGRAVAMVGKVQLSGFIAWCSWIFIHVWYLIGFTNKIYVFLRWLFLYFYSKRGVLLITHPIDQPEPNQQIPE